MRRLKQVHSQDAEGTVVIQLCKVIGMQAILKREIVSGRGEVGIVQVVVHPVKRVVDVQLILRFRQGEVQGIEQRAGKVIVVKARPEVEFHVTEVELGKVERQGIPHDRAL